MNVEKIVEVRVSTIVGEPGELRVAKTEYHVSKATENNYITYAMRTNGQLSGSRHLIPLGAVNRPPQGITLDRGVHFHKQFTATEDMIPKFVALIRQYYKMELLELRKTTTDALENLEPEEIV